MQMGAILLCCLPREERLPPRGPPPMALPPLPCENAEVQQQAANEPQAVFPVLNVQMVVRAKPPPPWFDDQVPLRVKPPPPHLVAPPPWSNDQVRVKPPPTHQFAFGGPLADQRTWLPRPAAATGLPPLKAKPPPPFFR